MKSLIKKVLLEHNEEKSKEERIQNIIDKKKYIDNIMPMIIDYFKTKHAENLEKIEISKRKIVFGNENFPFETIVMNFYFNKANNFIRNQIIADIRDFFNINIRKYGVPLSIEVFRKTWEKI